MDRLSDIIKAFTESLCARKDQVSHKAVGSFLSKLLEMAEIFKDECSSDEEIHLLDLLYNMLKQDSLLCGMGEVDLLVSVMKVLDLFFNRLMKQVLIISELQIEYEIFLVKADELHHIVALMGTSKAKTAVTASLEDEERK